MLFPDQTVRIVIPAKPVDFRKGTAGVPPWRMPNWALRRRRGAGGDAVKAANEVLKAMGKIA